MTTQCPKCLTENTKDSAFCKKCATPLRSSDELSITKTILKPQDELVIGSTFAEKYKIIAEIGRGGMGVVYKAEDLKLKRHVAIKLLPSELANDDEAKERFIQEAQAAAALSHPNICTIYEVEEAEEKTYIAMEFIEGNSLRERTVKGPLSTEETLGVAIQIAQGIAEAHKKGITHRDIKSANIMLDENGQVKIMDFGLAKVEGGALITKEARSMGTVAYMSPEQARGEPVDHRTDIWSLGVVLFEMMSGQHPFKGERETSIMYSIVHEEPTSIKEANPDIPVEMERIVERAIKKKPDSRYQSVPEMLKELVGYMDMLRAEEAGVFNIRSFLQLMRKPQIAIPALVVILTLCALVVWSVDRNAKVRWARQEVLPKIEQLVDDMPWNGEGPNSWEAYELAKQAEKYIKDDPLLIRLLDRVAGDVKISVNSIGTSVFAKPYADVGSNWRHLCNTPIDSIRLPKGFSRIKLEKEGFRTLYDIAWVSGFVSNELSYEMSELGSLPEEMELLPASANWYHWGVAPAGIYMPGLEHIEAEEVADFMMDRYEVTNKDYKRFVNAGGYQNPKFWKHPFIREERTLPWEEAMSLFQDKTGRPGPANWEVGDYPDGKDDYPVTGVSWYEALAYAEFVGKSLPTIFHWSRAAFTMGSPAIVPLSNIKGDSPVPVGSTNSMNRFGIHDLAGNVREWCANESTLGGRFILGGGWNDPEYSFFDAYAQSPFDRSEINGFRCIKYHESEKNKTNLEKTIVMPFRDFLSEEPVSEETFAFFLKQYSYDKTELNAVVEPFKEGEDWIGEKITFDAAYGDERVLAYLFLPKKGISPYQTVIVFPGSDAIHMNSSEHLSAEGNFILKSGRARLYPIYKSTYERGDDLKSDYANETNFWKEHVIMWAKDLSRSIDYLETRDDIDVDKIAYFGLSWGGIMGGIMSAVEKRLKASVLVVAGLMFQRSLPEVDPVNFLPRIKTPVLMLNGRYDFFCPYETSQIPFYTLLGTPEEDKQLILSDGGHAVPWMQVVKESLAWFDQYLGPVTKDVE